MSPGTLFAKHEEISDDGRRTDAWLQSLASFLVAQIYIVDPTTPKANETRAALQAALCKIARATECGSSAVVVCLIYLVRADATKRLRLSARNVLRQTSVFLLLAAKTVEDDVVTNADWAKTTGIDLGLLNATERRFAFLIDWKFHVTAQEFEMFRLAFETWRQNKEQHIITDFELCED